MQETYTKLFLNSNNKKVERYPQNEHSITKDISEHHNNIYG